MHLKQSCIGLLLGLTAASSHAGVKIIEKIELSDFISFSDIVLTTQGNLSTLEKSRFLYSHLTYTKSEESWSTAKSGVADFRTIKSDDGKHLLTQQRWIDTKQTLTDYSTNISANALVDIKGTGSVTMSGSFKLKSNLSEADMSLINRANFIGRSHAQIGNKVSYEAAKFDTDEAPDLIARLTMNGKTTRVNATHNYDAENQGASFDLVNASNSEIPYLSLTGKNSFIAKVSATNIGTDNYPNSEPLQVWLGLFGDKYSGWSSSIETERWETVSQVTAPVPEPETYALMGVGLVGLLAARRRKIAK